MSPLGTQLGRDATLAEALRLRAEASPDEPAIVWLPDGEAEAHVTTYGELDQRARAAAARLAAAAPSPDGDGPARVLVLHPPGIDFVATLFGAWYAGLVPVPAHLPRAARGLPRVTGIAASSRASLVAASARDLALLDAAPPVLAGLPRLAPLAPAEVAELAALERPRVLRADATALLQYTSGSTTEPRGVVLRHAHLRANSDAIGAAFGTGRESVGVIWLPPHHDMGLIGGILHPIARGFPVVLMSPMAFLQRPLRWLRAIARHRATISGGPTFAYDLVASKVRAEDLEGLDLSSWTTAFCGAEPIRAAALARFADVLAPARFRARAFVPCYGLAEATLLVTSARSDGPPSTEASKHGPAVVSCGGPPAGTRVAVVDPERGVALPEGEEGEVWVAGPSVSEGYFRAPEASAATFGARLGGEDGRFLRTGDLGYLARGRLHVTGRRKELVIVRGRNVHPTDVEESAQRAHPSAVAHRGACFGTDDGGVVLVQEIARGATGSEAVSAAIRSAVLESLDLALDRVVLVRAGTVPLTSSGKIQRGACREAYLRGALDVLFESRSGATLAPVELEASASPLLRVASVLGVAPERLARAVPLTALGIDSLSAVELRALARAEGAEVSLESLLTGLTWGELEAVLLSGRGAEAARPAEDAPAVAPATHVERAAVAHARAAPESAALVVALAGWVEGALDVGRLEGAVSALEARHDALRTSFHLTDTGELERRVGEGSGAQVEVIACEEREVASRLAERAWAPFDVSRAPLFRVVVARTEGRSALLLAAHHAIADLSSLEVLLRDLGALAAGAEAVAMPRAASGRAAARLERAFAEGDVASVAARWEASLPAPLPVLDLPRIGPRRRGSLRPAGIVRFALGEKTTEGLRALARARSASTFAVVLAAWSAVLHHWSGQRDVVVGCESAGRWHAGLAEVVGSFARPLPVHAHVDPGASFDALLEAVRARTIAALDDQAYPFGALVERLASKGAALQPDAPPVFQAVLDYARDRGDGTTTAALLGRGEAVLGLGAISLRTIELAPKHAHSEIALVAAEGRTLELAVLYDRDLFDDEAVRAIAADLGAVFARLSAGEVSTVGALLGALPPRRTPVRLGGNFVCAAMAPAIAHWLGLAGLPALVEHAPHDTLLASLLDGSLRGRGANVLALRVSSLARGAEDDEDRLARNAAAFVEALDAFGRTPPPPTVLAIAPEADPSPAVARTRRALLEAARERAWLSVVDLEEAAARWELTEAFDREADVLGDAPLSEAMSAVAGTAIARALRAALVPARKIVVSDADGTLWGGVAAEDGARGVRVDGPYAALQERLVALHDAGVLVAVVSKNVPRDVEEVFAERPEMPLRREHLVALRASWTPKPAVVRALAAELELGLDAFVFVDDNPVECAAMRAECPEVLVVELPERPEAIPRRLEAVWELDRPRTTEEDRRRTRLYAEQAARADARAGAGSLAAYIAALELVVEVAPLGAGDVARAAQLTLRTNQLNTTTRRRTEAEIASLPDAHVVRVRDRFGDYGLVGVLELELRGEELRVPALLLSCRVLGRGVEAELLAWLGARARERGARTLAFEFTKTARNEPARRMLEAFAGRSPEGAVSVEVADLARALARAAPSEARAVAGEAPVAHVPPGGVRAPSRLLEAAIAADRAPALVAALAGPRRRRTATAPLAPGAESTVGEVFRDVLGVDAVSPSDDFFALGGTSLDALKVAARVRRALAADVDVATLFEHPRLADFAREVAARVPAPVGASIVPPAGDVAALVPATPMQRRLWLLHRLDRNDPAYHVPFAARVRGPVTPLCFRDAFAVVVARHEALRLRFVEEDDEPRLALASDAPLDFVAELVARERESAWLAAQVKRPFDLAEGPLVRAAVAELAADEHVLLVVAHHAVCDGASLEILVRDLVGALRGEDAPPAPSFLAYAQAEARRSPEPRKRALAEAASALRGVPPLELPLAAPQAPATERGAVATHRVAAARTRAVFDLARDHGTTPFTLLLAAFGAVLARLAARPEVLVGVPVSLRDRAEVAELVGPLVETAVVRLSLEGDPDVASVVARTHEAARAAYARSAVPFDDLVGALVAERAFDSRPLVQVMLVEQPSSAALIPPSGDLEITPLALASGGATLDATLAVSHEPDGALRLALEYDAVKVSGEAAEAFLARLDLVLGAMIDDPRARVGTLRLVSEDERRRVLTTWAGPRREASRDEGLAAGFARQVDRTPDAVAITDEEAAWTYAELDRASCRIAHALEARGVRRGDRVGLALPRSKLLVAAVLATLRLGAPYVPLEPDLPRARVVAMADDAGAATILCDAGAAEAWGARALVASDVVRDGTMSSRRPAVDVHGTDLAYVLYTSGSTGRPKGVMVEHAGVANRLAYQEETFPLRPGEPVLAKTPYGFDVSVWEMLWPLRVGGHLVVAPPGAHKDPEAIAALVLRHGVTTLHFVPSMLGAFVEMEGLEALGSLTRVFASGEALPRDVVARLRDRLPCVEVHNLYGPTEASIEVTHFPVPFGPVPPIAIGRPLPETRIYVVDEAGGLLPPGAIGELWIAGVQVARGYLGDPERTQIAFVPDPFVAGARAYRTGDLARYREDGVVEFLGRRDHQVKIRGQRVELGEIEATLREHPGVSGALVVATEGRLAAYVVAPESTADDELRAHLAVRLPDVMVPAVFVRLADLPVGPSGKIARDRLPPPPRPREEPAAAPPETEAERALAAVWTGLLGRASIGRDEDFFALGGDSLLALKLVSRARASGLVLVPRDVFERPTLRGLAARARRPASVATPAVLPGERIPLLPMQAELFARHAPGVRDRFALSVRLAAPSPIDPARLARAFDLVAASHPALATRFVLDGARVVAQLAPAQAPAGVAEVHAAATLDEAHERAAASLRIEGPLVAAGVAAADLVVVVHHAVVDAVSFRVVLTELVAAYEALAHGEPAAPQAVDATFTWARELSRAAESGALEAHAAAWAPLAELPPAAFGVPVPGPAGLAGESETVTVSLGRAPTTALFAVLEATFAEMDEAIAGALAAAMVDLDEGAGRVRVVDVERHGRAGSAADDVPRELSSLAAVVPALAGSVGWLTALFPVAVRLPLGRDPRAVLAAAREAFSPVPFGGVTFGARAPALPRREAVVNFIGALAPGEDARGFRVLAVGGAADRDARGPRDHVLEVVAAVREGELELRFAAPPSPAASLAVRQLAGKTLEGLAALASELASVERREGVAYVHAPAPLQEGILAEAARSGDRSVYVEQVAIPVDGDPDPEALRRAWAVVVARHASLRSSFAGGFVLVHERVRDAFHVVTIPEGADALRRFCEEDRARGFDPAEPPLLRLTWVSRTLVLTYHHAIVDGWAIPILLREALAALRGEPLGAAPPPYRDVVRALARSDRAAARAHFRARLVGFDRPTPLPRDRALLGSVVASTARETVRLELSPGTAEAMARLARLALVTTSSVALAAHALTLARLTGEERVAFGVTVHGRPSEVTGSAGIVGLLATTVPFAAEAATEEPVVAWLARVQADLARDQTHGHIGLGALREDCAAAAVASLFVVENYPLEAGAAGDGLSFGAPRVARRIGAPFALVIPPGAPAVEIDFDPARISEADARDFLERFVLVIEALAGAPRARVRDVEVVTGGEREALAALAAPPRADAPTPRTLHARFLAAASAAPERVAVREGDRALTYAELEERSRSLAAHLRRLGVGEGDRVGVVARSGVDAVVSALGALRAGAAFVPLDPAQPEERLAAIVTKASPRALVAGSELVLARRLARADVVDLGAIGPSPETAGLDARAPSDVAYVLFTSGSTGEPKGVLCPHAGVSALIDDLDARAPIPAAAVASQWTSVGFDVSVWETFSALACGATLDVVPPDVRADAAALAAWLDAHEVASGYLPGFALEALAERLEAGGCKALRRVLVGVEPIATELVARVLAASPELVVVNGYGPTEASVCATLHTATREAGSAIVPIGRAVLGSHVHLLDARGAPVLRGVPGEIFVGGPGLAHGYLEAPAETAARFVIDPARGRVYRTGDRAVRLEDGALLFLGRGDQQVKVLGVRVELGEVEAALARLSFLREAAVVALGAAPGTSLVAAVVPAEAHEDVGGRVRASLRASLPEAFVPTRVVAVAALPRSVNGKVDRAALADLVARALASAPRTRDGGAAPTDEILAGLVEELLGVPARADVDFLAAGGDSLTATRLATRLRDVFAVDLPLSAVLEAGSQGALARRIDALRTQGLAGPDVPIEATGSLEGPTSFAQERLLFIHRLAPDDPVYNLACAARVRGPLEVARLARALDEVVRRHGALRTVFEERGAAHVQRMSAPEKARAELEVVDLRGEADPLASALLLARDDARRPFDLARGPLFRARLAVLGEGDHVVTLGMHHVVADGWSLALVLRDVLACYEAAPSPLAPAVSYVDFAAWQRRTVDAARVARLLEVWRHRLANAPARLALPEDHPRPAVQTFRGDHVRFTLGEDVVRRLDAFARRSGATVATVLLAALDALLVRWTGETDLSVGVSLANRRRREVEGLVGFFVNVVVVRCEVPDAHVSFEALLRHVRERALEAYDHQDVPFDRLVEELRPRRTLAHAPLFQVNFVYDDAARMPAHEGLTVEPLDVETGTARFDLALSLLRSGSAITGALEINTDVLARETAERLVAMFERLLEGALEAPSTPLDRLPLGPAAWSEVLAPPAHGATFLEAFEAAVDRRPDAPALVVRGAEGLSYAELDRRSSRLARQLRASGVGPEVLVAVCAPRSIDAVVAILAVLRAGGAYAPIDPELPISRVAAVLDVARPALVLAADASVDVIPTGAAPVLVLEELEAAARGLPDGRPEARPDADDLAYVIFTSGSTGAPSGVEIVHRGLANLATSQARAFGITAESRVLQFASLGFDASVSEIVTTLASGALLDLGSGPDRSDVAEALGRVTLATLPPSLLAALDPAAYPGLLTVVAAGEALPPAVAARWLSAGKRLVDAYGPTEATVCATLGDVAQEDVAGDRAPSIGRAMAGVTVDVLDAGGAPVPPGVVGELAIGGLGVARGFRGGRSGRFLSDPRRPGARLLLTGDRARQGADGRLYFLGRADDQLKVRGHRIEPGDVEAALRKHALVSDVACVLSRAERLVAYVVPEDAGAPPRTEELLRFAAAGLPAYMVPDAVAFVASLPRNTSGKVDRRALAALDLETSEARAERAVDPPRSEVEAILARAFAEVLRVPAVGIHANFFELGGDSIASIQVAAHARRAGVVFGVKDLFLRQTVAELASVSERVSVAATLDVPAEGEVPLTPLQRWLLELGSPEVAHYNQSVLLDLDAPPSARDLEAACEVVVAHHDALRLRFAGAHQSYGEGTGRLVVETAPRSELASVRARAQRSLSLDAGPVGRIVLFEGERPGLLVVVHHLVMDVVSMRILVTDLLSVAADLAHGRAPALPPPTASFKAWATALVPEGLDLAPERRLVERLASGRTALFEGGAGTRGEAVNVEAVLDGDATRELLREALPVFGATMEHALVAALGLALAPDLRGGALVVDVERHGRDPIDPSRPVDVTRTVGWFTTLSPLRYEPSRAEDAIEALREAKEAMAAVPRAGAGLAALGYVGSGEVVLNYLGAVDANLGAGVRLASDQAEDDQSPRTPRPAALEITSRIEDGRLRVRWTFVPARHAAARIERWAGTMIAVLRELSRGERAPVYATGDFPEADLSPDELSDVLTELGEGGDP